MCQDESTIAWDAVDIKLAIKRYFAQLVHENYPEASQELEFLKSIHREWSYHPLMRRCDPQAIAIIDDFLKWLYVTPLEDQRISDFTIRRLLR
jgi:hypothetical protein